MNFAQRPAALRFAPLPPHRMTALQVELYPEAFRSVRWPGRIFVNFLRDHTAHRRRGSTDRDPVRILGRQYVQPLRRLHALGAVHEAAAAAAAADFQSLFTSPGLPLGNGAFVRHAADRIARRRRTTSQKRPCCDRKMYYSLLWYGLGEREKAVRGILCQLRPVLPIVVRFELWEAPAAGKQEVFSP
jgi:hypothetical protein